jgi:hypothetical protein
MDFRSINFLAILVCVVLNILAGFIWYHPSVFFKPWWRGLGKKESDQPSPSPMLYVWTLMAAFVEGVFVSLLVSTTGSNTVFSGLQLGFMLWLGFVATTNLVNNLFAGRGFKVWSIEAGNHLVYLLISGALLSIWR